MAVVVVLVSASCRPNMFNGYFKAEDKTAEVVEADGWFHTGEIRVRGGGIFGV